MAEAVPSRHRVLVIDDEDGIQQALADTLIFEGYDVRSARNGREGLDILTTWKPEVVLLDLRMPVMDGWSFRKAQLALPEEFRGIPVVIISGALHSDSEAKALGAFGFLAKPFDLDDVLEIVEHAVREATLIDLTQQGNAGEATRRS